MNTLFVVAILAINVLISWYNTKVCGRYWSEAKALGGFARLLMWCGAIQSVIGFSMAILFIEVIAGVAFGQLSPKAADAALSLWYLGVIVPCIGTGLIITVHSWVIAWRDRSWQNVGGAAWNTFASGYNIYSAADGGISSALDKVGDLFSGDSKEGAAAKLVIALVILSLAGGILLTWWMIGKYDRQARLELKASTN